MRRGAKRVSRIDQKWFYRLPHLALEGDGSAFATKQWLVELEGQHGTALGVVFQSDVACAVGRGGVLDVFQTRRQVVDDPQIMERPLTDVVVADDEGDRVARLRGFRVGKFDDLQAARFVFFWLAAMRLRRPLRNITAWGRKPLMS